MLNLEIKNVFEKFNRNEKRINFHSQCVAVRGPKILSTQERGQWNKNKWNVRANFPFQLNESESNAARVHIHPK